MMKNIILIISIFISTVVFAWQGDAVQANKEGIDYFKKQSFSKAQEKFSEGLSEAPFSAPLQLNLGLSFDGSGQQEKAIQTYEQVPNITKDDEVLFASYFNIAELYGRQKKIPEALNYYQKALEVKPDSIEAKTNIELLIQQQQQGGGGQNDQKDNQQDKKDGKDKDQQKKDDGQDKEDKDGKDKDQNKDQNDDQKKDYGGKNKPQPQQFKSQELTPGDAKKILQELDRQEQRVRAEYNKKQRKERANGKDW